MVNLDNFIINFLKYIIYRIVKFALDYIYMFEKIQINGGNRQDLKDYKLTKMKKERGQSSNNYKKYRLERDRLK